MAFGVVAAGVVACLGHPSLRNTSRVEPQAAGPLQPTAVGSTRFAVVGDFGSDNEDEAAVAALVKGWNPDFIVTTGDNNYNFGLAATMDGNIGRYYAPFIGHYKGSHGAGATENRFWPTPGNHDWFNPGGLAPYLDYFTLPGNERYYDVVQGPVHIFALDSDGREPDGTTADSVQGRWLKDAMARSGSCWKFVFFHHPPFSSGEHGNSLQMRWPFKAWGAHAVFNGHDHTYERLVSDGLLYFVDGLGGAGRYGFHATAEPESQFRYNATHGAMLVTVTPDGADYEFRDTSNRVVDHVREERACPPPLAAEKP
jgi:hypothetical protein